MITTFTDADLRLDLQFYEGNITLKQYAERHTEHQEAFLQFCQDSGLRPSEQVAEQYFDRLLKEEEKAHTEGLD